MAPVGPEALLYYFRIRAWPSISRRWPSLCAGPDVNGGIEIHLVSGGT